MDLVPPGSFCWNAECAAYANQEAKSIRCVGRTKRGVQRYQCVLCKKTFTATRGTPFYGVHEPEKMRLALKMLGEGMSISGAARIVESKEDTVRAWLAKAASHARQIAALQQQAYKVERGQIDALWSYVAHKGEKGGAQKSPCAGSSGASA
jgi:transposase-like protein